MGNQIREGWWALPGRARRPSRPLGMGMFFLKNRDYVGLWSHPTLYNFPLEFSTRKIVSSIIFTINYIISPLQILRPTATPTCKTLCRENTIFSESSFNTDGTWIFIAMGADQLNNFIPCSPCCHWGHKTPCHLHILFPVMRFEINKVFRYNFRRT